MIRFNPSLVGIGSGSNDFSRVSLLMRFMGSDIQAGFGWLSRGKINGENAPRSRGVLHAISPPYSSLNLCYNLSI